LSHRWSEAQPWKTTRTNFSAALNKIHYDELPKTFQDAAVIAKELGTNYLWVDSISSIKDDNRDWTHQSSQMGLVFAQSVCTLAA
ncbi:hypothetical protein GQ44DRAFT_600108, partial [Phaeosphaeriaceae sp. PMI808]